MGTNNSSSHVRKGELLHFYLCDHIYNLHAEDNKNILNWTISKQNIIETLDLDQTYS